MSTYIFAIGGTGVRVLRSLTMLLASGVKGTSTTKEIVPIIIDYDGDNGDTKLTQDILEKYQNIHLAAYGHKKADHDEHFFCTPMPRLRDRAGDPTAFHPSARYNIHLENMDDNTTYSGYLGYNNLNRQNETEPTRHLLDSLYSTEPSILKDTSDNPKAELHMKLHHGFRGCPNIGCNVTKQLYNSHELETLTLQPNDRVFIIGSIFGGTGASGIPMLLDYFKTIKGVANKVGVLAVTPYFKLDYDPNSPINSATFVAKTKAALKAYESTVYPIADAVYIVGDDGSKDSFANHEGGDAQKNNAHVVELAGAIMALDFIKRPDHELVPNSVYEFGMENPHDAVSPLVYSDFYHDEVAEPYFDPMANFVIFRKFCKDYFFDTKKWKSADIWLGQDSSNNSLRKKKEFRDMLESFFDEFDKWITELEDVRYRPLKLFNINSKEYCELLQYKVLKKKAIVGYSRAFEDDDIPEALGWAYGDPSSHAGNTNHEMYAGNSEELFLVNFHKTLTNRDDTRDDSGQAIVTVTKDNKDRSIKKKIDDFK